MRKLHRGIGWLAGVLLAIGGGNTASALDVGAFGDMSISHSNTSASEPSFRLGSIDLYAAQYIDDKTRALFELQFQTFSGGDITTEIQRFWVMREFSDAISVGMGRFHSPLGYWNRHFHHGILLQDTVSRPFILSFEGSPQAILPAHMIGVLAEGDLGSGGFRYEAAIANSNAVDTSADGANQLEVQIRADRSSGKTVYGRLHYGRFDAPFKPGIFAMQNDVVESSADGLVAQGETLVRQNIVGFDLRYQRGRFDMLTEYYRFRNDARPGVGDGGRHDADAWFAQFGYRITENLKATYRHEHLDFDNEPGNVDPYFMTVLDRGRPSLGGTEKRDVYALRYEFSESNAIMFEINARERQVGSSSSTAFLSWAFVMY